MMSGTVKFFHDQKGWGFIECFEHDDIFVHYADIVDAGDLHRTLVKGDSVQFDLVQGDRGQKAVNVIRLHAA